VLTGLLVIWAARRFLLTGDRAFAVWLAAYAVGRYGTEWLAVDFAPHLFGLRVNQWVMALVFAGALGYLYLTRGRPGGAAADPARPARLAGHICGVSGPGPSGQVCTGSAICM
jgi:prolipoprotein diacylglyceryltransferase